MAEEEPLYCPTCGRDWTKGCSCPWPEVAPPPREERYCHICGVIPAGGLECPFYDPPGSNKLGCNKVIDRTPSAPVPGMRTFRYRISGHTDWENGAVVVDVLALDAESAVKTIYEDLQQDATESDLRQLQFVLLSIDGSEVTTCQHGGRAPSGLCLTCGDCIETGGDTS